MQNIFTYTWTIALLLISGQNLSAQFSERPPCGQALWTINSAAIPKVWLEQTNHPNAQQRTQLIIPVVIHIVWRTWSENISDEIIASQLEALNRDFNAQNADQDLVPSEFRDRIADIGISFCLASETPTGQFTNGILRVMTSIENAGIHEGLCYDSLGGSSAWDTDRYLNIWVASTGGYVSGYGSYPGLSIPEKTGVVIDPKYFGLNQHPKYGLGRTLAHEIGHYFGLNHIWSNDPECTKDDGIADTPMQMYQHIGCPKYPQSSCTDSDMYMNFMDYVDDPCMLMFTKGQKDKIWATIQTHRPLLLSNEVEVHCLQNADQAGDDFQISPNPVESMLTITFLDQHISLTKIEIFNIYGRLVIQQNSIIDAQYTLDIGSLDPGIYCINIGKTTRKFIKT